MGQSGSRGFVESAEPFKLAQEPRNPSPPFNLTRFGSLDIVQRPVDGGGGRGRQRFQTEAEAVIRWVEPKKTDLPIDKYKISWRLGLGGGGGGGGSEGGGGGDSISQDEESKKTIPGTRRDFRLQKLLPNSIYHVQVVHFI